IDILLRPRKRKRDVQCFLVRDTQAQAGPSKLSSRDANMLHSSLEEVLRDQKHLATFRAFLRSEFSEENLDFWLACEAFTQIASPGERHRQAEHIYQEFLHPNARREVNVDQCTRERIQSCLALQQQQQQQKQQQQQQQKQQQQQQQQQQQKQQQQQQQQRPLARCFEEAQKNIYLLMERDPWPRFLGSGAGLSLRQKASTVWYI
ncbi:hypothetical protein CRUP_020760, partial [Coryphaenoides rupestris]